MDVFLETERLILRPFTPADIDNLVDLNSDPEVTFYINGGKPISREDNETIYLPAYLAYHQRHQGYGFWAIEEKSTGSFLGWLHFRAPEGHPSDEPELGYRLKKSAWGKGYATEASRAVIDKGFHELGVRRVFATTMTVNVGSRRVMEKAGLQFVRTFFMEWPDRIPGDELGDVEYALTRQEWENRAAQQAT